VPIVLQTQTIGIAFDKKTGLITATAPGLTQFDPTSPDTTCLSPPNDIPIKLVEQSPIFQPTNFSFGGINLGTAQYADAFQRANLSTLLGPNATHYSVLLDPITTLASVRVSIPANEGLALTNGAILGPPRFCAPLALIDVIWLDSYLTGAVIPRLIQNGLSPNALPIFIIYNALLTDPTTAVPTSMVSLATSATGYYSVTGTPIPVQGYIVSDFDSSAVLAPILENVQDLSAEVTSWINNPYAVSNFTPPYAGAGASSIVNSACSNLMEVATPLFPRPFTVVGSNGFSYSLQEAAYFSWFFGGPSAGPQGFFSNNGTLQGGAGSPCP
jgi:hypothetical protein